MASFSILTVITLIILSLSPNPTFSFSSSIQFPNPNSPSDGGDSLIGDAHFTGDENTVQLNRQTPSSSGVIFPNTPFNVTSSTSLSSHFTFKIGNVLSLVIIPASFRSKLAKNMSFKVLEANRLLSIEFYANVCEVSFSRVCNVSKISNVLEDGVKLSTWIDYRAVLKRLDVRVSKLGDPKPVEPLISYGVDLGEVLKGEEVLLGLASVNEKDEQMQVTYVYSWSSEIKDFPKWMHSIPVNPEEHSFKEKSGFVFGTGCGVLAALVMFFVWSYVVDQKKVVQGEDATRSVDFKYYEKIDVVEVKNAESGMK